MAFRYMRIGVVLALLLATTFSVGQSVSGNLAAVRNARLVYVTSYNGRQFSPNMLPEDRAAVSNVQAALQKQGYTIVPRLREAEMIVAVQSRANEDVLAVYDRRSWHTGTFIWRAMEKGGLAAPDMPLMKQFDAAMGKKPVG